MSVTPLYDKDTPDVVRGFTAALWHQSLDGYASNNPAFGVRFREDFLDDRAANTTVNTAVGGWYMDDVGTLSAASITHSATNPDGSIIVSGTPDGASEGVYIKKGEANATGETINLPTHATSSLRRGKVIAEVRVVSRSVTGATAGRAYFYGLQTNTATVSPITAGGASMVNVGHIGFWVNLTGDLVFTCKSAVGGTADSATIIAGADLPTGVLKCGWAVNENGSVEIVVNGVRYDAAAKTIDSAALPTTSLCRVIAVDNGANTSVAGTTEVDSFDVYVANNY